MFRLTEKEIEEIIDSLDGTGGWLVKSSELRYWIEYHVNKALSNPIKAINWDSLKCEEASPLSHNFKIDCGLPASVIVWHNGDRRAWAMCMGCADHNLRNRGGIELARKP